MRIRRTQIGTGRSSQKSDFSAGEKAYYGPKDGRSQAAKNQYFWRPVIAGLTNLATRVEIEGEENLPTDGANLYAITHVSQLDVPLMGQTFKQDVRTMMTIDAFRNPLSGKWATDSGFFPVDREQPSQTTRNHPAEVLAEGKGFAIYPEGTFTEDAAHGRVGPFKKGAAAIALSGGAESIVPIAIHYEANQEPHLSEDVLGILAGATVTAGTILATSGGPVTKTLGGIISGAITGTALGSYGFSRGVKNSSFWSPGKRMGAIAGGGAAGAVIGGLAGGILANSSAAGWQLSASLGALAGLSTVGLNQWWQERPVARIKVGKAFTIEEQIAKSKRSKTEFSEEASRLTEQLHQKLGQLKSELSGVAYDPEAPKIKRGFPELSRRQNFSYPDRPEPWN